jgi:general secretion pathway protein G
MYTYDRRRHALRSGFTLLEILLVLAILLMLTTVAIVSFSGTREGAKIDTTQLLIQEVESAVEMFNLHLSHYPTAEEGGLDALREKPRFADAAAGERWRGPYLKKPPIDGWGNPVQYERVAIRADQNQPPYRLWSNGPDGISGTEDDIGP